MNWNKVVEKAVREGVSDAVLKESAHAMSEMLEYVKSIEPELYWNFKNSVLMVVNGSPNNGYGVEDDEYVTCN